MVLKEAAYHFSCLLSVLTCWYSLVPQSPDMPLTAFPFISIYYFWLFTKCSQCRLGCCFYRNLPGIVILQSPEEISLRYVFIIIYQPCCDTLNAINHFLSARIDTLAMELHASKPRGFLTVLWRSSRYSLGTYIGM
jgi:hypothetical protein